MEIVDPSGRVMRWRPRLAEYDFKIQNEKWSLSNQPETLSRLPTGGHSTVHEGISVPCFSVTYEEDTEDTPFLAEPCNGLDTVLALGNDAPKPEIPSRSTLEELIHAEAEDPYARASALNLSGGRG